MYSGTKTHFYCSATQEVREGTIHCLSKSFSYRWKISVLKPQCNLFLDTKTLIDLTSRDGSVSNPWFEIFLGDVSFTDLTYQDDNSIEQANDGM